VSHCHRSAAALAATAVFFFSDPMMPFPIAERLIVDFSTQLKAATGSVAPLFICPNLL
jgi:hypothetical protein